MATRAQIARLQQRIEEAAAALGAGRARKVISIIRDPRTGETEDEVLQGYLAEHPGDRDFTDLIVRVIVEPTKGNDGHASAN